VGHKRTRIISISLSIILVLAVASLTSLQVGYAQVFSVKITSHKDGQFINNKSPTITGTASGITWVKVLVDGEEKGKIDPVSPNWQIQLKDLSDGKRTIKVEGYTLFAKGPEHSITLNVDTKRPILPELYPIGTKGNPVMTNADNPSLRVEVSEKNLQLVVKSAEAVVGIAPSQSFDMGELTLVWINIGYPKKAGDPDPDPLDEGIHDFHVLVRDRAGNESPTIITTYLIDKTPPPEPRITFPTNGTITNDPLLPVRGTQSEDERTGISMIRIEIFGDGDRRRAITDNVTSNWEVSNFEDPLKDGAYTVQAESIDGAANRSERSERVYFIVDTIPPVISVPQDIIMNAADRSGTMVNYAVAAVDIVAGEVNASCDPPSGSPFPVGQTVVNCTATDAAGNTSTKTFTVTINEQEEKPIVEKISLSEMEVVDQSGAKVNDISMGQQVVIQSNIANNADSDHNFAYIVLVEAADGITVMIAWKNGELPKDSSFDAGLSWIPDEPGNYTMAAFVWESIENPVPLSFKPVTMSITVT
jgi:hypothetical protein